MFIRTRPGIARRSIAAVTRMRIEIVLSEQVMKSCTPAAAGHRDCDDAVNGAYAHPRGYEER
jgi:hypothetical protein